MAAQPPGAGLIEAGESPGGPELGPPPSPTATSATRELLDRLTEDLTALIRSPEGRYSKRNLNAFVDALKRVDYVHPLLGAVDGEA